MKLILYIFCFLLIVNCSEKKYVIYNAVKGNVIDAHNRQPVKDAKVFVNKSSSNAFDTLITDSKGNFFIDGLELPYQHLHDQINVSPDYFIEKSGYLTKKITVQNLKKSKNNKLDTIDLGNISLEKSN
ncbi:carboxypeptidase regulatory-like domain-containing protein [Chryseobacterium gregarium]|uniref:carboxypeptidase regulatory-like domain-containing protein n=1 Tax=Chryseobacterium gregarium TaxID=456299 RepID=UPI000410B968|nr:carboxypeptidase regulatory-like domain-containing protein [Chryseobacterium gregarium]